MILETSVPVQYRANTGNTGLQAFPGGVGQLLDGLDLHQAGADGHGHVGPALLPVEPHRPPGPAASQGRLTGGCVGQGDLAGDAGQAGGLPLELGNLLQQVGEGVDDHLPAVGEVRRLVPVDVDQRLLDGQDPGLPGAPEEPLVVLGVAAGDVLVDEADPVEGRPAHDDRGGVGLHDPGPQQVGEGDPAVGEDPGDRLVLVDDPDAAGGDLGVGVGIEGGHLAGQLLRQPLVVVVAEGDVGPAGGQDAGVAGAGQAGVALGVADYGAGPSGGDLDLDRVGLRLVEDDHDLDLAGVGLLHHPPDGPVQQHGAFPGGDDDGDLGEGSLRHGSSSSSSRSGAGAAR